MSGQLHSILSATPHRAPKQCQSTSAICDSVAVMLLCSCKSGLPWEKKEKKKQPPPKNPQQSILFLLTIHFIFRNELIYFFVSWRDL